MSRTAVIVLVAVIVLSLLLCCCIGTVALFSIRSQDGGSWSDQLAGLLPGSREVSSELGQELRVDTPATLVVTNDVGIVTVRAADVDTVEVRALMKARAATTTAANRLLDSIDFEADSSGNRAEIRVDIPSNPGSVRVTVDLNITVPRNTSVEVRNAVGEVRITGVEGTLQVRGDVGEVTIRDVVLEGPSEVQSSVGRVDFQGRLPESGEVRITAQVGEVQVTLPSESRFLLDASTGVGDISCQFDLQEREEDDDIGPAHELSGRVGEDPAVLLILRAGTGGIDLRRD